MKFCTECGVPRTSESAKFCGECGAAFQGIHSIKADNETSNTAILNRAQDGDAEAMKTLGLEADRAGDFDTAQAWYLRAAELGHVGAMRNLGSLASEMGNDAVAETWLIKALSLGEIQASLGLGNLYLRQGHLDKARDAYLVGAQAGDTSCMYSISVVGAKRGDLSEGIDWLHRSSELGLGEASLSLGQRARNMEDEEGAKKYWTLAAKQGNITACGFLAGISLSEEDYDSTIYWCDLAFSRSDDSSSLTPVMVASLHGMKASACELSGRYEEAISEFKIVAATAEVTGVDPYQGIERVRKLMG